MIINGTFSQLSTLMMPYKGSGKRYVALDSAAPYANRLVSNILKLHPEESGVQFFGFHGRILEKRKQMRKAETQVTEANSSTTPNR